MNAAVAAPPASLIRYIAPPPPPFVPVKLSGGPIEVTDNLVGLANEILDHTPRELRLHVFGLLGLPDNPTAVIPSVSVARSMGLSQEHAEAVRTLVGLSTLAE